MGGGGWLIFPPDAGFLGAEMHANIERVLAIMPQGKSFPIPIPHDGPVYCCQGCPPALR
jgi:hypothetical protein